MPDRHLDQRDEGIKIFDLDLEEQAKNLLHAKCVMVPDKLTTRCPHFSVGPARTGTRTTWIRRGLFLTRSNFPHGHGKTHQHAWESLLGRWEGAPWHAILTHQGPLGTHVPWLGSISPRTTRDTFRMASITPNGTRAGPIMASLSASIRKVCHGLNFT
ncbi:hypothetical protein Lal_00045248 [Lupinus albus]|nr:hypothetical protein Lal_00045248 [Lupinus albus]